MKIAFTMSWLRGGGAERVVCELANTFSEIGHEISILVTKSADCAYFLNAQIRLIDLSEYDHGILSRIRAVRRCLQDHAFDVVISFLTGTNIETIMAAYGTKIPVIVSERNNPHVDPRSKISRFLRAVTYPHADGYVFQTPDARDFFHKKIQKKSVVIQNPINPELPDVWLGERERRVVNVGRLFPQKNQKLFIDAFAEFRKEHPEFIAEIYGDGPLEQELREYIRSRHLEDAVFLRGFSKTVLYDIRNASMFVLSSDYEGMSNALIEAVGMGIPCISTDHPIGGARITITDEVNGYLVPVGDIKAMADKMAQIADHNEISQYLSANGLSLREQLSVRCIAEEWLTYIRHIQT